MLAYFEQFVNSLKKPKALLILANVLLVFFLILLSNSGVLPFRGVGDFGFFVFLGLVLALYRPGWGFLFFVGTAALENINLAPVDFGIAVRPYQFFGGITVLSILIRWLTGRLNFKLVKLKWPDYLVGIIIVAGFLSALFADDRMLSLKLSAILLTFGFLYLLTRNYIQEISDLEKVVPFFLSSGVVVIFYGLWQNIRFMQGLSHFEVMPGRPNATFTEADWFGIYLSLFIATIYILIFYFNKKTGDSDQDAQISNSQFLISNQISNSKSQIPNNSQNSKFKIQNSILLVTSYGLLITSYVLLILTVSRSAWLGALAVSILYLVFCIWHVGFKNENWKGFFQQLLFLAMAIIGSVAAVYIFNLTNFQLFNRAQSTGTGLQKITISCDPRKLTWDANHFISPESIVDNERLNLLGCRHINLEDIDNEKSSEQIVMEVYRQDPNINIRKEIYQKSWAEIKKHPVLGIGWGNIGNILGKDERGAGLNSSNIFLEVWLGSGILGIMAFLAVWISAIIMSLRKILKEDRVIGVFMLIGTVAILVPNSFNAGLFLGFVWLYLAIVISLNYANRD